MPEGTPPAPLRGSAVLPVEGVPVLQPARGRHHRGRHHQGPHRGRPHRRVGSSLVAWGRCLWARPGRRRRVVGGVTAIAPPSLPQSRLAPPPVWIPTAGLRHTVRSVPPPSPSRWRWCCGPARGSAAWRCPRWRRPGTPRTAAPRATSSPTPAGEGHTGSLPHGTQEASPPGERGGGRMPPPSR